VVAAAVGAAAIATAAAPATASGTMRFILMCIVIPASLSYVSTVVDDAFQRVVDDRIDVVLADTPP
jgi:hypothetical protein